jgi:predicted SAM-dependent methyltransferase
MSVIKTIIGNQKNQPGKNIALTTIFVLENYLGSKLYRQRINPSYIGKYLNLGCGTLKFNDWVNADLYKLDKILRGMEEWPDWMLDATKAWNCPDDFWGGIYSEHMIEHINYLGVVEVFKECYRTLQQQKWLRIAVPDLNKYIRYYNNEPIDDRFKQFSCGAHAISELTQNWGHISVWDENLLGDVLKEVGFTKVNKVDFEISSDPKLLQDTPGRRWESLYMEAQKPAD